MKKMNNRGFSALIILLIVVVLGAIGGTAYYLQRAQDDTKKNDSDTSNTQKTNNQQQQTQQDETANWEKVESVGGGFSMKVPDGWVLSNYSGNVLNGDDITYTPGKEAIVTTKTGAYAGDQKKFNVTLSEEAFDAPQWQSPNENGIESTSDYTIGNLKGKKYSIEWKQSLTGVTKGDKIYQYVFNLSNGKQLNIVYMKAASDADNLKTVEQAIQTITIK